VIRVLVGAALVAFSCAVASAQDRAGIDWNGGYVGGAVGGFSATSVSRDGDVTDDVVRQGWLAMIQFGHRIETGNNLVLGVELSAPVYSTGGKLTQTFAAPPPNTVSYDARVNWALDGSVTLGYDLNEWLPFISAGLVVAEGAVETDFLGVTGSPTNIHTGYSLGAGIEYAIDDQWSIRAQYKYVSVSREDYAVNPGVVGKVGMNIDFGLIGVNYRF
jgi:outer membrane immunogenic protein